MMLGFLVRGVVDEARLFQAVAKALGVPLAEVARFDIESECDAPVLVEIFHHMVGFLTDVNLYLDPRRIPDAAAWTSMDVAPSIAHELEDELLVSLPAGDIHADAAYTWYLIDPDGQRFVARQIIGDHSSDDIEIDRATLGPVSRHPS